MQFTLTCLVASLASTSFAAPQSQIRDVGNGCASYTIINTRGSSEPQGESMAFKTMNSKILAQVPGGKKYFTVYPASWDQKSEPGTDDVISLFLKKLKSHLISSQQIIKQLTALLTTNPSECVVLQGYSQGATATVNALSKLDATQSAAVKAVLFVGNPCHKAGLACNVDGMGGVSTKDVSGILALKCMLPSDWVAKTSDICQLGDGICDTLHGAGISFQHLSYSADPSVQSLGEKFIVAALQG